MSMLSAIFRLGFVRWWLRYQKMMEVRQRRRLRVARMCRRMRRIVGVGREQGAIVPEFSCTGAHGSAPHAGRLNKLFLELPGDFTAGIDETEQTIFPML